MTKEQLLQKVKQLLEEAFKDRFRGLILYGSEVRGESGPDSDLDFLVLLEGPVKLGEDLQTIIDATYPLQLEIIDSPEGYGGRLLHAYPVSINDYEAGKFSLYRNARAEGRIL